jgi:hypothetical protein
MLFSTTAGLSSWYKRGCSCSLHFVSMYLPVSLIYASQHLQTPETFSLETFYTDLIMWGLFLAGMWTVLLFFQQPTDLLATQVGLYFSVLLFYGSYSYLCWRLWFCTHSVWMFLNVRIRHSNCHCHSRSLPWSMNVNSNACFYDGWWCNFAWRWRSGLVDFLHTEYPSGPYGF